MKYKWNNIITEISKSITPEVYFNQAKKQKTLTELKQKILYFHDEPISGEWYFQVSFWGQYMKSGKTFDQISSRPLDATNLTAIP